MGAEGSTNRSCRQTKQTLRKTPVPAIQADASTDRPVAGGAGQTRQTDPWRVELDRPERQIRGGWSWTDQTDEAEMRSQFQILRSLQRGQANQAIADTARCYCCQLIRPIARQSPLTRLDTSPFPFSSLTISWTGPNCKRYTNPSAPECCRLQHNNGKGN